MSRKIYIEEKKLEGFSKDGLLVPFIYKALKEHNTSLGNNLAFPQTSTYPFDYTIIKERYRQLVDAICYEYGYQDKSDEEIMSILSKMISEIRKKEKPMRDMLERLCINNVIELFGIPKESVDLECKIVDKVEVDDKMRLMPEEDGESGYTFDDVDDVEFTNLEIGKRRFINALVQGASYHFSSIHFAIEKVEDLDPDLAKLYSKANWLNEYLLFRVNKKMSDRHPMQGSYVKTLLGSDNSKTSIKAQGLTFPLLQRETIRGLFELFASHGLPSDRGKAMYVIRKADFLLAEPWDMRFGPELWRRMFNDFKVEDGELIPYIFTKYVSLEPERFNRATQEILSNTRKGKEIKEYLISLAEHDTEYQMFTDRMRLKSIDRSLIQDEYMAEDDLDRENLSEDSEDGYNYNGNIFDAELDDDMVNYYSELASQATIDNIGIVESDEEVSYTNCEQLMITIKGVIVPKQAVDLFAQPITLKTYGSGEVTLVQPHLFIHEALQQKGLGTKILAKMVYEFGSVYSGKGRMVNDRDVPKMFDKLAAMPNIYVYRDKMCTIAMLEQ